MLVCSCNVITKSEIEQVITELLDEDCWRLIVPVQVYHAMSKRGKCCGCFPNVVGIIVEVTEAYHRQMETSEAELFDFIEALKQKHHQCETARAIARQRMNTVQRTDKTHAA